MAHRRVRAPCGAGRGAGGDAMTPEQIDRVFGRGRLKMVTGDHVEVFREAAAAGERRRYTKCFLKTDDGDFAHWTEREWRILARLIGHGVDCVPHVVQFDRGSCAERRSRTRCQSDGSATTTINHRGCSKRSRKVATAICA